MIRFLSLMTALLCYSCVSAFSQGFYHHSSTHYHEPNSEPREHALDIRKMSLDVRFKPEEGKVIGKVTHHFIPLRKGIDSVMFDAMKITVKSVSLGNKPIRFVSTDSTLTVFPSSSLSIEKTDSISIVYEATPRKGIYFIGWNSSGTPKTDGIFTIRKQIWTQGQEADHRYWIPMYDATNDKYITETIITFDKEYNVLSNGTLFSERDNKDGTKTWHYSMTKPHAGYLLTIGIGKYDIDKRKSKSGVPLELWYYPEYKNDVPYMYKYSTEAMDFLESETGIPYPWEKYSQIPVQDFIFGAMENTTATTFGDFFHTDKRAFIDRNYIGVNVHELTHQWFGDLITQRDPKNIWLHESFATFYPKLFDRKYEGEDQYQWNRRGEHNSALTASEKDRLPIVHTKSGTARIYPKGSAVLDMLMHTVGEEHFRRVIKHYLNKHRFGNVVTSDFYHAFQDTLGLTLDRFFDQWLYRGGEPHYEISRRTLHNETHITIQQIHTIDELTQLFSMPITVEVWYDNGKFDSKKILIDKQQQTIIIPHKSGSSVSFVLFDPSSIILKKTTFKKQFDELKAQAVNAPNMIDRFDAIVAMEKDSTDRTKKYELYNELFSKERFFAIRAEIARQCAETKNRTDMVRSIIRKALQDPNVHVRKAILTNIRQPIAEFKNDMEKLLTDSSYSVIAITLDKLCSVFPESTSSYLKKADNTPGMFAEIAIKRYEIEARSGDKSALEFLRDFANDSYEFRTRQFAFNALKRLNHCNENVVNSLFDAMINPNTRLASAAQTVLEYFYQQTSYHDLILRIYDRGTWTNIQRDELKKVVKR